MRSPSTTTGSSEASPCGINVVKNYTHAYTTFTVRSVLNPELPNNHGSLAPIKVDAPEGTIVNAVSPQPCTARHVVGMFLPNALLKALAQIRPEQAMAEGSGAVWTMQVSGNHDDGSPFITAMFTYAGGVGARADETRARCVLLPHRRRRRADRGGRGVGTDPLPQQGAASRTRAARAPRSADSARPSSSPSTPTRPWQLNAVTSRLAERAARASSAANPAATGRFTVNGEAVTTQARVTLQPGDDVVGSTSPVAAATAAEPTPCDPLDTFVAPNCLRRKRHDDPRPTRCSTSSTTRSDRSATAIDAPAELYTSPEVLAFERDAVFAHDWLCVGRTSRVPDVGD